MAGIPGAGKTEFAKYIQNEADSSLVPIEHDELVSYIDNYKPQDYYNFRKAGSVLVTQLYERVIKQGYAFIFDGTLSHDNGIRNIQKAIQAGYTVYVVYIVQDVKLAWELTIARELVTKRAIEKDGFIATCNKINKNLLVIFSAFRSSEKFNFWIINKQGATDMHTATAILHGHDSDKQLEIEKALNKTYNVGVIE